jgi:hypothetical protein
LRSTGWSPIPARGKETTLPGWPEKITATTEEIIGWEDGRFSDHANTGLVTAGTPGFDIDILNAEAADAVEALVRERFGKRGKIIVRTGRAPKRLIPFRCDEPFKIFKQKFVSTDDKIEFLAQGQMFVGFGIHPDTGKPYAWRGGSPGKVKRGNLPEITAAEAEALVEDAAKLLVDKFGYARDDAATKRLREEQGPLEPADPAEVEAALEVVPSDDRDNWFKVGCALVNLSRAVPDFDWFSLYDRWSSTCEEKYDEDDVAEKWHGDIAKRYYHYTFRTIFWLADKADLNWRTRFAARRPPAEISEINEDYAYVIVGGKAAVMRFDEKKIFELLRVEAFKGWFVNKKQMRVDKKIVPVAEIWLKHPARREYAGIEFAPPGVRIRRGYYNLWRGFAVEPRPGDCSKFLAHLRDNVAQGHEPTFNWIVAWFADIFQNPGAKKGTSVAFRGSQGVGKTKVGEVIGSLIGDGHYVLVSSPRYVTGQFNAHMASLLLLHADEAFWAGDKSAEGKLKDMVTGHRHLIEHKHFDPVSVMNLIRLFVTGNADWVVPAAFGERRFCTLDVGEAHKQDHAYFKAIDEEMDCGGREALLHYLLSFDLSMVNLRAIPKTAALLEQQISSLTPEQAWWLDVLHAGTLPPRVGDHDNKIKNSCFRSDLHTLYVAHAKEQGASRRAIETKIGMFLSKMIGPNLGRKQLKPSNAWYYIVPPLKECRERFAQMVGQDMAWDDEKAKWRQG